MSNGLSVIILSKTASNLIPCVEAVRKNEPAARITVIDDGVDWSATPWPDDGGENLPFEALMGESPFVFARNHNIGIQAAGDDDVVLLNDDALLETPNGFSAMRYAAESHPNIGLISASTNLAGNPEQHRRRDIGFRVLERNTLGNSFPTVAFICVLIPRRTINLVGLLDERFTAYGFEDNDYCRRVMLAGLQIAVHDGCFVDHSKLKSSFRGAPAAGGKLEDGRAIYLDKWGSM